MLLLKRIMFKPFFHDFLCFNISAYQIFIYHFEHVFAKKIAFFLHISSFWSYFQIWMSYIHIISHEHSYDIIGQILSIGQKFRRKSLLWSAFYRGWCSYFCHFLQYWWQDLRGLYIFWHVFLSGSSFSLFWTTNIYICCWWTIYQNKSQILSNFEDFTLLYYSKYNFL